MALFFVLAAIVVLSAFAVVFNKNVVHSALALLVNFSAVAIFYFTLNAQFLGVAQLLVYAGAIVVLFLFVVMLLGANLGEQVSNWITGRNVFFIVLGLVFLTVIGTAVFDYTIFGARGDFTQKTVQQVGQTEAIAAVLFTEYTLPFQLVAVLLTVGVIGVVWLAQHQQRFKFKKVVAVLDAGWVDESQRDQNNWRQVNWLQRQLLFDFDLVKIVHATDEEVERFAVQVGNDTDDWRLSGYRQMFCLIAPDCKLSENTIRLLQNTFGEVKISQESGGYFYD